MTAYYNENNPEVTGWLYELMSAGVIAPGIVDTRSIEDIHPNDLIGFTQCHFFAGIGVWSYALRLAGWPDDRPVWTGSCPCRPFSAAGKGGAFADERHLWPTWFHLITQRQPPVLFGEQVASKDALVWLDLVHPDLEAAGYAVGVADLCAAGVGAPHIRQRLFFVADAERRAFERNRLVLGDATGGGGGQAREQRIWAEPRAGGNVGELDNLQRSGLEGHRRHQAARGVEGALGPTSAAGASGATRPTDGFWRDADWLFCRDGRWRPVEPGAQPLAHGAPARVVRLRGYGNAINAEAAATFIKAYLDVSTQTCE